MSVGAGSIKRAVKAAGAAKGPETAPQAEEKAVLEPKASESEKSGAEKKTAANKKARKTEGARGRAKTVKDSAETVGKKQEPKGEPPAAADGAATARKQAYEAYGIGQQLPVHLL